MRTLHTKTIMHTENINVDTSVTFCISFELTEYDDRHPEDPQFIFEATASAELFSNQDPEEPTTTFTFNCCSDQMYGDADSFDELCINAAKAIKLCEPEMHSVLEKLLVLDSTVTNNVDIQVGDYFQYINAWTLSKLYIRCVDINSQTVTFATLTLENGKLHEEEIFNVTFDHVQNNYIKVDELYVVEQLA